MLKQIASGAGDRWCSQRLPLSQETNFPSGVWSKREGLVEDEPEHTAKIRDLDSCNFTLHLYLPCGDAVLPVDSILSVSPPRRQRRCDSVGCFCRQGQPWICAQLCISEMEQPQIRWSASALGQIICLCPVPTPGKCLLVHHGGHLLWRVPLGTATTCPAPAGTYSESDAA